MVEKIWRQWTQRLALATAFTLLAACGSSSKFDEFMPTRIVSVGDHLSYLGTTPAFGDRFTVNNPADTSINNWVLQLAAGYGLINTNKPNEPDPNKVVSQTLPNSNLVADLEDQINLVTASSGDMLVVNGGMADIIFWAEAVRNGNSTAAQALAEISKAGSELQAILLRQQTKYRHILVINAYDLKDSPYATRGLPQADPAMTTTAFKQFLHDMTRAFNTALIRNAGTFASGTGIRLFDAETLFLNANLYNTGITTEGLSKGTCNSFLIPTPPALYDPAANDDAKRTSCTTTDSAYFFADDIFPTPVAHRLLGSQAYAFLRSVKGW